MGKTVIGWGRGISKGESEKKSEIANTEWYRWVVIACLFTRFDVSCINLTLVLSSQCFEYYVFFDFVK